MYTIHTHLNVAAINFFSALAFIVHSYKQQTEKKNTDVESELLFGFLRLLLVYLSLCLFFTLSDQSNDALVVCVQRYLVIV